MSTIPVSTVVSVSIAAAQPGLLVPNPNNICILSKDTPAQPGNLTNLIGVYATLAQVGVDWGTTSETYLQAQAIFAQKPNILAGGGQLIVYYMTGGVATLSAAIAAVEGLAYAAGYLFAGFNPIQSEVLSAVAVCNAIGSGKPIAVPSYQSSDFSSGGLIFALSALNEPAGIPFYYGQGAAATNARVYAAGCFAAQMATNFLGQNTAINLNLKTLQGIAVDSTVTPAIITSAQSLGCNLYPSIQGVAGVLSYGGPNNIFFDNVYNLNWFSNAVQIAIFNSLKTTGTKIPQTEGGMTTLKNAALSVCQQANNNGYLAPGTWNGVDTFGSQSAFIRNIGSLGYYIYSSPIALQAQTVRATRAAPLMQLAAKLAGAINSASISITVQP